MIELIMSARGPGGGQGVNSIIKGKIGLCNTSAKVTSRLHIGEATYREVRQLRDSTGQLIDSYE